MFRRVVCLGLFCVALGATSAAHATEESEKAEAKEHLQQGVKAYSAGRFKDAVDAFLLANKLVPSPALSFNIAKAYEKLGDSASALSWYRDYLRRSPSAQDRADVEKIIRKYEAELRKKGVQQMTVLSDPAGATVMIDGEPVGVTPWTGELAPGTHIVLTQLRGYSDAVEEVQLSANRALDVSVTLERQTAAATDEQKTARSASADAETASVPDDVLRDESRTAGGVRAPTWIAFGVAGAALGGALAFELMRRSAEDEAKDEPTQVGARDAFETMESRQTTARVLGGVGAAALLVGGVLLVFDLSRSSEETSRSSARFGAGCAPTGCAFTLGGSL